MILDPVNLGVLALVFLAALFFCYFARQGSDDGKYEKLAKASSRILVEKKGAGKGKSFKSKKENKKNEKRTPEVRAAARLVEVVDVAVPELVEMPVKKPEKPNEMPAVVSEPVVPPVVKEPTKVEEVAVKVPPPEPETRSKKKASKKEKGAAAVPVAEQTVAVSIKPTEEPANAPDVSVTPAPTKPVEDVKPKAPKKKIPTMAEMNEHTLLSRLSQLDDLEPVYVEFLTRYFNDINDNVCCLHYLLSLLYFRRPSLRFRSALSSKKVADATAKADQQTKERKAAQKDCAEQKVVTSELVKKIASLEEEAITSRRLLADYKLKDAAYVEIQTKYGECTSELTAFKQNDANQKRQIQKLQHDLEGNQHQLGAAIVEMKNLRAAVVVGEKAQKDLVQVRADLAEKNEKLSKLTIEFKEIQLLARDAVANQEPLRAGFPIFNLDYGTGGASESIANDSHAMSEIEKEMAEKESAWMIERTDLQDIIMRLQQQISEEKAHWEQEQPQNLPEDSAEVLELRKKIVALEYANENSGIVRLENDVLKGTIDNLKVEIERSKELWAKNVADAEMQFASAAGEIAELKKINADLAGSARSMSNDELTRLRHEKEHLIAKNEELRARNQTLAGHLMELQKCSVRDIPPVVSVPQGPPGLPSKGDNLQMAPASGPAAISPPPLSADSTSSSDSTPLNTVVSVLWSDPGAVKSDNPDPVMLPLLKSAASSPSSASLNALAKFEQLWDAHSSRVEETAAELEKQLSVGFCAMLICLGNVPFNFSLQEH
ncbi:unnamed protein product, partial [Mesorhabditis spiculigera]